MCETSWVINYKKEERDIRRLVLNWIFEFKEHAKTEKHLERHHVTLNRLSEFLAMVQVASKEDSSEVLDKLNKEPHMGNLILDIEDKKQYIDNLEEKLKAAKVGVEKAVASHQDTIRLKEPEIAELEGVASQDRLPELEHGMIDIIADLPGKKWARADRKSSKRDVGNHSCILRKFFSASGVYVYCLMGQRARFILLGIPE